MDQYFVLDEAQAVRLPQNADKNLLSELLSGYMHGRPTPFETNSEDCTITIGTPARAELGESEFIINVTQTGIYINGRNFAAAMRGYMTFLEQIEYNRKKRVFQIKCGLTAQSPKLSFRCVHLCVFPETTLDFLKKCIRSCGMAKYSHIIIEFWGMLQFDCMKELSWDIAYTKEQVRPLIREANAMGMEVIPMFNHFGHASASRMVYGKHVVLDQNPAYEYLFMGSGWEWDFESEEVYTLLSKVRRELIELCGKGSYFHLGCDEAYSFVAGEYKDRDLSGYLNRVQNELEAEGRRGIIWGDMLFSPEQFKNEPESYCFTMKDKDDAAFLLNRLNKNIIIADWQYSIKHAPWKSSVKFKENGFDVVCCPWHDIKNAESAVESALSENLFGIIHTTWNTLPSQFPTMLYSGIACWCGDTKAYQKYHNEIRNYAALTQRRVYFVHGNYKNAGWSQQQTGPGL